MATLAALAAGFSRPSAVLTTVNAATQRVPAREVLAAASFTAEVGAGSTSAALRGYLARMGYGQAPTVTEPGRVRDPRRASSTSGRRGRGRRCGSTSSATCSRARGGSIRRRSGPPRAVQRVELAPVSEVILDEASIQRFRTRYRAMFGAAGHDDPLYEAVSAGRKHQGYEHWLPFFHERLETLFDYLPGAPVLLDDQVDAARAARWAALVDQYEARAAALAAKSKLGTVYKPVPPDELYLDDAGVGRGGRRAAAAPAERAAAAARAGRHRRRRADRARLRAGAAAGAGEPVRRAGRACRGAAQARATW